MDVMKGVINAIPLSLLLWELIFLAGAKIQGSVTLDFW